MEHFSDISGLTINFDKSALICLGKTIPDWLLTMTNCKFQIRHIKEGFRYLGLDIYQKLEDLFQNFNFNKHYLNQVINTRKIKRTSITGRILQIKQLVASRFTYKFQLLPTPPHHFLETMSKEYVSYVWEYGRHRLNKAQMMQPKHRAGFNMLDIFVQEKALKLSWFHRLLGQSYDIQFWKIHICYCFSIPMPDVLRCNLLSKDMKWIQKISPALPPFWEQLFTLWFKTYYIPPSSTSPGDVRNNLLLFNSAMPLVPTHFTPQRLFILYKFLEQNNVHTIGLFYSNKEYIYSIVSKTLAKDLYIIELCLPDMWVIFLNDPNIPSIPAHMVERLTAGLGKPKFFREILTPVRYRLEPMYKWERDLQCSIQEENWKKICKNIPCIPITHIQDFYIQFLNRSYHTRVKQSIYKAVSPNCRFCNSEAETYIHAFWDCPYVFSQWTALDEFCNEFVTTVKFSPKNCILSEFDNTLMIIMVVLMKYHIHVSLCMEITPKFSTYLEKLERMRKDYFHFCKERKNLQYFNKVWHSLNSDYLFHTEIGRWKIIEMEGN